MDEIKIEKGIKMPTAIYGAGGRNCKYPWLEMGIGDSFLMETNVRDNAQSSAARAGKVYKRKFSVRKVDGGYRIWRVK